MHWIKQLLMRSKVDQQVSWWSRGKKCYQVPRKIFDKHVRTELRHNVVKKYLKHIFPNLLATCTFNSCIIDLYKMNLLCINITYSLRKEKNQYNGGNSF